MKPFGGNVLTDGILKATPNPLVFLFSNYSMDHSPDLKGGKSDQLQDKERERGVDSKIYQLKRESTRNFTCMNLTPEFPLYMLFLYFFLKHKCLFKKKI